jgi:hypothetical protein
MNNQIIDTFEPIGGHVKSTHIRGGQVCISKTHEKNENKITVKIRIREIWNVRPRVKVDQ